jgi:hypothetical protein
MGGLRKYLGFDRRRHARTPAAVEVEFYIWDTINQKPRTGKVKGRLTDISPEGACLQTNHTLIEGHHILLDEDQEGKTPLIVDLPSATEGDPWTAKAQVLWYNRVETGRPFRFDVGLKFLDLSTAELERLKTLLSSLDT